ncbi:MAG: hypothetical protein WC254_04720 [Candidatus Woesearchaeota archaeon]|jgi:Ser/Thr protein kinase RdoA (MazF antagonist)
MLDGTGFRIESNIVTFLDRYRTLSLDELLTEKISTPNETIARDIATLLVSGALTAQTWETGITPELTLLAGKEFEPPQYTERTDFEVKYHNSHNSKDKQLPILAQDPEYFTRAMNIFFDYLKAKGVQVKHVDLSHAPVTDSLELPGGIVTVALCNTNITTHFFRGSHSLKQLIVSWNDQIQGTVDLTSYSALELFNAGNTNLDNVIVTPSLRALYLGCTQCEDIEGVEKLEQYTPGKRFTGRVYPAHLTFLGIDNCSVAELPRVRQLYAFNAQIPNAIPHGVRELDVCWQKDITDMIIPETVEKLTFNPATIRNPQAFYARLPEHLREQFQYVINEHIEDVGEEQAFAEGWKFLWKPVENGYCGAFKFPKITYPEHPLFISGDSWRPKKERFEVSGKSPVSNVCNNSVAEALLIHGVGEEHAGILASQHEIVDGIPAEKSKNLVYIIQEPNGKRQVVKFVEKKEEADIEALALYHFSRDSRLGLYVPRSELEVPSLVQIGDEPRYVTVQSFVSDAKADRLLQGTKKEAMQYLNNWMRILARLHVYGTEIMDELGNEKPALRLCKEKDLDRIAVASRIIPLVYDLGLQRTLVGSQIEQGHEFIHQDTRKENRIGYYLIDFGHAGRGNGLLDIARVVSDYSVQKHYLTNDDERRLLKTYISEKNRIQGKNTPSIQDLEQTCNGFTAIRLLYFQAQSAYQITRRELLTPHEEATLQFQTQRIPFLERQIKEGLRLIA